MTNHFFELFNLPIAFDIDKVQLKERFLALQKQHHPDNTSNQAQAEHNTALINHAFDILNNDDSRAVYLLELAGIEFNADKSISDESFLMQMMDYRMALEDASFDKDVEQIKSIGKAVNDLLTATAQTFNTAYQNQDWTNSQIIAQKLKFLNNLYKDCLAQSNQSAPDNDDELYV